LEGTNNDHLVQLPDTFRAEQRSNRVTEGIAQRAPGHGQAGGTNRLSGSLSQRPAALSVQKRILVPS